MGALLPLLYVDDYLYRFKQYYSSRTLFLHASVTFFIWNILTLWWIAKVTLAGALFIICFNTLEYSLVFWLAHVLKRKIFKNLGNMAIIFFWLSLEYINLNIELALPWLHLGNGFAHNTKIIQWYEYTGVLGGSAWVLISNILIFNYINITSLKPDFRNFKILRISLFLILAWIIVPIILSFKLYKSSETGAPCNVAIIQPNIDPFSEKFGALSQIQQLNIILNLADSVANDSIDYFIAPETAIDNEIWEDALNNNYNLFSIREFNYKRPKSAFIIGAITYREYPTNATKPASVRFEKADSIYYDAFNTTIQLDTSFHTQIYHKSKLVIGVEKTPLLRFFKFFNKYLLNLGGTTGSLGQDRNQNILYSGDSTFKVAPLICYESVFGEYVHFNIRNGANLIFVLTNDGWWDGTPGYTQHLNYSRLRAIENRRWIARSANTGISSIIDAKGNIVKATKWWTRTALTAKILANNPLTFYAKNGDFIGRVAVFFALCILMIYASTIFKQFGARKK
jgi:apolipoprotein N-acyltransferase